MAGRIRPAGRRLPTLGLALTSRWVICWICSVMPNPQLVRHAATVLRQWREATNISASMKTFHCYDIDNSVVLIRHHRLDRQAALWKIAMKMCGLQQDFVTWKICQEASADMRGQQIIFKPNCFINVWKHKDGFGFERTAETKYQRSQCWDNLHVSLKLSAATDHTDDLHSRLDHCMHCKRMHKL